MIVAPVLLAAAVAAGDATNEPDAAEEPPAHPEPAVFVRAGAGVGRGELFLASDHGRPSARVPLSVEAGLMFLEHLGASASLVVEPGRSDHGIAMTRVAFGGTFEAHLGPVFAGVGPHLVWFGATRKSHGPNGGFLEPEPVLWRLGAGGHAMLGLDVHALPHAGVFTAVRGDVDALVSLGSTTVPYGSVTGVVGLSFY